MELLEEMLSGPAGQKNQTQVRPAKMERSVHHDLESFILVLFYAAMKRGLESRAWDTHPEVHRIRKLYCTVFGGHTIDEIVTGRTRLVNRRPDFLLDVLDKPMSQLLYSCRSLLERQYVKVNRQDFYHTTAELELGRQRIITYGELYQVYDLAIRRLSEAQ